MVNSGISLGCRTGLQNRWLATGDVRVWSARYIPNYIYVYSGVKSEPEPVLSPY